MLRDEDECLPKCTECSIYKTDGILADVRWRIINAIAFMYEIMET